ncbi:hypothetical protein LINGRAHAP2_LOCUS33789 [Linum grandiflorum]
MKLPPPPPQIDAKRRIMSKDINTPNPSFRVYYGGASVAVPFTWETAPGTPKHHSSGDDSNNRQIPLSPPPSFYSAASINSASSSRSSFSSKRLLLLPLVRALSGLRSSSSRSFSSAASSATAASFSPGLDRGRRRNRRRSRCFSCSRLPVVHHGDVNDDDEEEFESEGRKGNCDDVVVAGSEIKVKRRSLSVGGGGWDSIGRMRNVWFGCGGGGGRS